MEQFIGIFDAAKHMATGPLNAAIWVFGIGLFALLISARNKYGKE